MKRIINGKTYDTDTATKIDGWGNALGYSDFRNCEETLYVTKKGAFYLVGSGGPLSKYATSYSDGSYGGSRDVFTPLTRQEALAWMEHYSQDAELIQAYFGDMIDEA